MQLKLTHFIFFCCLLMLSACGSDIDKGDFDSNTWKQDPLACQDKRSALLPEFEIIEKNIIGASEAAVRQLLGKPDYTELYKRRQKFYYYYIDKGTQCVDYQGDINKLARKLQIRFDAVNEVNEIVITAPKPM
ncbi:MAG: outer membrane protein assembly factor BamE [Bernardetiaceae bacterium]|nr:outer membrane protein assembly factor BamE [Bernardetiaceae bacterium]